MKNHTENSSALSSGLLSSSDKVSITTTTIATSRGFNSTIPCRQGQDVYSYQDVKTNHPSYELSKTHVKQEDTLPVNTHQIARISMNFDSSQQEYVPIESVCHLLINDIHNTHSESAGNKYLCSVDLIFSSYHIKLLLEIPSLSLSRRFCMTLNKIY